MSLCLIPTNIPLGGKITEVNCRRMGVLWHLHRRIQVWLKGERVPSILANCCVTLKGRNYNYGGNKKKCVSHVFKLQGKHTQLNTEI